MTPDRYAVMAVNAPAELLALVRGGTLAPHELTFAAEYLGAIEDAATARDALLPLLDHPNRMVREGVLYGLAACALDDEAVKARAARIAREDESATVREIAAELFQGTTC